MVVVIKMVSENTLPKAMVRKGHNKICFGKNYLTRRGTR